jgi:hypothetical protein
MAMPIPITIANAIHCGMPTKLDKALKREIIVRDQTLVATLTPDGLTLTEKGHRKGKTFTWYDLWSGGTELMSQLQASVTEGGARRE